MCSSLPALLAGGDTHILCVACLGEEHAWSALESALVLPTKPVRTTSALVGKAYSAAGQAAACLHTMSLLQAYQG